MKKGVAKAATSVAASAALAAATGGTSVATGAAARAAMRAGARAGTKATLDKVTNARYPSPPAGRTRTPPEGRGRQTAGQRAVTSRWPDRPATSVPGAIKDTHVHAAGGDAGPTNPARRDGNGRLPRPAHREDGILQPGQQPTPTRGPDRRSSPQPATTSQASAPPSAGALPSAKPQQSTGDTAAPSAHTGVPTSSVDTHTPPRGVAATEVPRHVNDQAHERAARLHDQLYGESDARPIPTRVTSRMPSETDTQAIPVGPRMPVRNS